MIPGGVDGHCHVAQVTGRFRTLDDYKTTSTAALWGGTTTIIDFGIPRDAQETPLAAVLHKKELAQESRCDVALHGSVVSWDETVPWQLEQLAAEGVRSVKMYTTNRGTTMADGDTILKVMREMVRLDGLTYIHAEHDPIIADCTAQHADDGRIGIEHLHRTRPELAEEISVKETLAMAEYTEAPVYFVHQSTPGAVDLVTEARGGGQEAYSETCPHYLTLDDTVYGSAFPEWYACCPPMRSPETVAALKERLAAGAIHTVSSDHSCYDLSQKRERTDDIRAMPHGLPGVETRMPVTFTAMMESARNTVEDFVEVFSAGPARINAVPGQGGHRRGLRRRPCDLRSRRGTHRRRRQPPHGHGLLPVRRRPAHRLARRRGRRRARGGGRRSLPRSRPGGPLRGPRRLPRAHNSTGRYPPRQSRSPHAIHNTQNPHRHDRAVLQHLP